MVYQRTPANVRSVVDENYAKNYRTSDEQEVQSDNHKHFCDILRQSTLGFARGISVLDLGCGTGRYFHCLQNVDGLTALDGSIEMLKQARFPIRGEAISIKRINMICADVLDIPIAGNFDLIYSIGVFGEHVPWDLRTCNR